MQEASAQLLYKRPTAIQASNYYTSAQLLYRPSTTIKAPRTIQAPTYRCHSSRNILFFLNRILCFSAILDFIIWYCTSLSKDTWNFEIISQSFLFFAQQQKRVFKPSFSNLAFQTQLFKPSFSKLRF